MLRHIQPAAYTSRGTISDWIQKAAPCNLGIFLPKSGIVKYEAPQWSILGPLFFSLYINDLAEHAGNCKVKVYADDTTIYTGAESEEILKERFHVKSTSIMLFVSDLLYTYKIDRNQSNENLCEVLQLRKKFLADTAAQSLIFFCHSPQVEK